MLLIACVNVANLLLARMAARQRETAVRRALGAGPGRLVRQMLTESVMLACIGGIAGTGIAIGGVWLFRTLATTLPRPDLGSGVLIPRLSEIAIDGSMLIFTLVVSIPMRLPGGDEGTPDKRARLGAAVVTSYLKGMLFGLTPLDPVTFMAAALTFGIVAMGASYVPARRATNVDPLVALRHE